MRSADLVVGAAVLGASLLGIVLASRGWQGTGALLFVGTLLWGGWYAPAPGARP